VGRYVGWGCILNWFMISSLPCFYAFCWPATPTSCYIFNVFYSCVYIFYTRTLYTHLEITLPLTSWILSHGRCWLQLHHHKCPGNGGHKVQLRTRAWTNAPTFIHYTLVEQISGHFIVVSIWRELWLGHQFVCPGHRVDVIVILPAGGGSEQKGRGV